MTAEDENPPECPVEVPATEPTHVLSRRALLGGLAALAAGAVTAADSTLQPADESALGGATDAQDRVPVVDILQIDAGETYAFGSSDAEVYNGRHIAEGGDYVLEVGDGYTNEAV